MTQSIKWSVLLLCLGMLSACGFHLRGSSQIAEKYSPLNVQAIDLNDAQLRQLEQALRNAGATLSDAPSAARLRVSLTRLKDSKLTSSSSASVELRQLSMQIIFSVLDAQGEALQEEQEITQNKTLELDSDNVLSHQDSIDTAVRDLQKDLIRSMIYRLQK
jgi:LPS-assembly lipoprotein